MFVYSNDKTKIRAGESREGIDKWFIFLIVLGYSIRILFAYIFPGHPIDVNCFKAWAVSAAKDLDGFYSSGQFADYPPLYIYILFMLGKAAGILNLSYESAAFTALIKLPSITADIFISYLIFKMTKVNNEKKNKLKSNSIYSGTSSDISVLSAALFLFNPVSVLNSSIWGQVDAFFTLFIMLMFLYINKSIAASAVFITLAVLMKPQGLIFAPVILLEFLKRKDIKVLLKSAGYSALAALVIILPFALRQGPLWIFNLYFRTAEEYKYATLNAFNLFMLAGGNWKNDAETFLIFSCSAWGMLFLIGLVGLTSYFFMKSRNIDLTAVFCGILLISGTFIFSSRMHERYMYPVIALIPAAYGLAKDRRLLVLLAGFSFTNFYNTLAVFVYSQRNIYWIPADDLMGKAVSLLNLILFIYMVKIIIDILLKNKIVLTAMKQNGSLKNIGVQGAMKRSGSIQNEPVKLDRKDLLIVLLVTVVYLGISIANIGGFNIPATSWRLASAGENFIVQFDREYDLARVYYYNGYGDAKFKLEYRTPNGTFVPLSNIEKTYLDFYSWRFAKVQAKTSQIRVTAESYELLNTSGTQTDTGKIQKYYTDGPLLEMAFVEEGSEKPVKGIKIISKSSDGLFGNTPEHLFDEQDLMEYAPSNRTGTIFDEIYHVRTAYEFLNRLTPYENTHPPLGKSIIALGITVFGMNPFGWRIMGVIFGAFVIPMMYLFGRKLFGSQLYGLLAAFLMMFDFMNLVQARIGTVDVFVVLFILIMYYFMYDSFSVKSYKTPLGKALLPLFLSGLFFGIGASAKWISIYAGAGLAVLYFWARWNEYRDLRDLPAAVSENKQQAEEKDAGKDFAVNRTQVIQRIISLSLWCVLFFVIIPIGTYLLSYIPFFGDKGYTLQGVWSNQAGMLSYHSGLQATHSFASAPWTWPFIVKPVWFYTNLENAFEPGLVSTVATMGNPAIWWVGLLGVPAAGIIAWKKRDWSILPVFAGLVFQYLPWFFVTRLMFIYHFYSSVPFVIFCIVYVIKNINDKYPLKRGWIYGYMSVVFILFALFYPVLTGLEVSRDYIENYLRWFKNSWYF